MRHMSLLNHTIVFYNINGILRELDMPMNHFREIAVISGTDYNSSGTTSLSATLKHYKEYKSDPVEMPFYDWLVENTDYIRDLDYLNHVCEMFKVETVTMSAVPNTSKSDRTKMVELLKPHGFVFV